MRGATRLPLDPFVRALHRRLVLLRALEGTGLGALAGCALGGILIPLLLWRGVPAFAPTIVVVGVGAACGLLWSAARRPTPLQAAVEADRQLALADLLATALSVSPRSRESDRDAEAAPWLQAVIAAADEACGRHAPSQVILHRLGGRAWGGIALAAMLVATVAALTAQEPAAKAARSSPGSRVAKAGGATTNAIGGGRQSPRSPDRARSQGTGPQSERPPAPGANASEPEAPSGAPSPNAGRSPGSPGDTGTGGGAGRARGSSGTNLARPPSSAFTSANDGNDVGSGGAGNAATRPAAGNGASGGTVTPNETGAPKPARWDASAWTDDARRAREAIDAGRVPESRRDLVRDYFERP